ncbi:MAG TPA: FUSC family protein, partial [Gammaproteobacteria bacterium]|nr:FUSC family protein [Gammaproteobacteria bacterium]
MKRATGLLEWWRGAPSRLVFGFAIRGTVAMMLPFVVLVELHQPYGAVFAALGAQFAIFADAGGAYQRRVGAMLLALVIGAASLFVSARLPSAVWLASLVLAIVAFAAGMGRVFGGSGIAIGPWASIMFLIGLLAPADTLRAAEFAGYFALGSLWVIAFQLALWRLRPYRLLFDQVAVCYEICAELVHDLAALSAGADSAAVRRRLHRRHAALREAIRTAEATLEALRLGAGHSSAVFDHTLLLLAAVSREAAAAVSLRAIVWPATDTAAANIWQTLFANWRQALADAAQQLSGARAEVVVAPFHAAFDTLDAQGQMPGEARAPLRLALVHLDAVAESGARLSGLRFTWREALPRLSVGGLRGAWTTLAAQFTFRSMIFRHALRVAVAAGFGLWISGVFDVTHRLWLPMTTILVLQPEFGATWQRLWQRVGGTLAGVLIAGGLHFLLHGTTAEIVVITVFAFGMFFFIRSHYGVGVVMLTPMVLLLLGVLTAGTSASLIVARGADTLIGAAIALAAAYLLWPLWQRGAFVPQCAAALRAERDYLAAAFARPGDGRISSPELMQARHRAERESDNAEAMLRKMLSEPRRERANSRAALEFMTYLRRLADNALSFSIQLGGGKLTPAGRAQGGE